MISTNLAHSSYSPKKENSTQKIHYYYSHNFSYLEKKFLLLSLKNFLCSPEKNNFPNEKNFVLLLEKQGISYTFLKHYFLYFLKNVKHIISDVFWIYGHAIFMLANCKFKKHFYFSIFCNIFFLYSTSLCFSSSDRVASRWWKPWIVWNLKSEPSELCETLNVQWFLVLNLENWRI